MASAAGGAQVPPLGTPLALYTGKVAASATRSALAAEALLRLGFAQPLSLAGGFMAWSDQGRAVEGGMAP